MTKRNKIYRRAFGGGGSFETLNFSLPSYDADTKITKLSAPSSTTAALKVDISAAKAASREEWEASCWAKADAKDEQKKAYKVAAKEVANKAAAKEAAKEECKVREQSLRYFTHFSSKYSPTLKASC